MSMADGVQPVYNLNGNDSNTGAWGDGGMWIFFLFFLLAWGGGNGFGFGGNGAGLAAMQSANNGITNDFMYTNLQNQLRDNSMQNTTLLNSIQQGLSSTAYENLQNTMNAQINSMQNYNGIQNTLLQGFNGINSAVEGVGCGVQRELLTNRYESEKNTQAIVNAIHSDGEATRAMITQNTIQDLRDRLQTAEMQNSQCAQTAAIVNQVAPRAIPAYVTCSPYVSNNCGCGCGANLGTI